MKQRDIVAGAVAGLVGGIVASFVMNEFQTALQALTGNNGRNPPEANDEEPANVQAAKAISENVFGHRLASDEKENAGEAMHYAMGGVSGMIYGVASELTPAAATAAGLPFGAAVWLVADDVVVPALGLSKPASEFPALTHAYALTSHLVYGLTTDLVRCAVRRVL